VPTTRRRVLAGSLALVACRLHARAPGPSVRQRAPAFALPDERGRMFALDALDAHGPAVLLFYRGHW
jgi:hypothetical protein